MEERTQVLELALATQSERDAEEEENDLTKNKENLAKIKQFFSNYLAKYMIGLRDNKRRHIHSRISCPTFRKIEVGSDCYLRYSRGWRDVEK